MRVNLQPSYILHSRPYRDSSALLEVLTAEYGRISLVARGSRRKSRGGSTSALLQAFTPLLLSFSGRGDLKNLTATEPVGSALRLRGERLFSGMYVNELLVRLLHRHDPHPQLFAAYGQTLEALAGNAALDTVLRHFEFTLLHELGYSIDLNVDGRSGEPVQEGLWYHYHADFGLLLQDAIADSSQPAFAGTDLLAMAAGEFGGPARLTAKRLLRQALAMQLGGAPLKSRDLFRVGRTSPGHASPGHASPASAPQDQNLTGDKT
jgi:DNA repair protein RecO (recombination protein O)